MIKETNITQVRCGNYIKSKVENYGHLLKILMLNYF